MKKRGVYREDGNSEIGLGHLFRLFAHFEILNVKGDYNCIFVTKENSAIHVIPNDSVILRPLFLGAAKKKQEKLKR